MREECILTNEEEESGSNPLLKVKLPFNKILDSKSEKDPVTSDQSLFNLFKNVPKKIEKSDHEEDRHKRAATSEVTQQLKRSQLSETQQVEEPGDLVIHCNIDMENEEADVTRNKQVATSDFTQQLERSQPSETQQVKKRLEVIPVTQESICNENESVQNVTRNKQVATSEIAQQLERSQPSDTQQVKKIMKGDLVTQESVGKESEVVSNVTSDIKVYRQEARDCRNQMLHAHTKTSQIILRMSGHPFKY